MAISVYEGDMRGVCDVNGWMIGIWLGICVHLSVYLYISLGGGYIYLYIAISVFISM